MSNRDLQDYLTYTQNLSGNNSKFTKSTESSFSSLSYLRYAHQRAKLDLNKKIKKSIKNYTGTIFNSKQLSNLNSLNDQVVSPDRIETVNSSDGLERCLICYYAANKGTNKSFQHIYHFAEKSFLGMWERELAFSRSLRELPEGTRALLEKRVDQRREQQQTAKESNSKAA